MIIFLKSFIFPAVIVLSLCSGSIFNRQSTQNISKNYHSISWGRSNRFQNDLCRTVRHVNLFPKTFSTLTTEECKAFLSTQEDWRMSDFRYPYGRVKELMNDPPRFSMKPYKKEFMHPSRGKITILVIPILDLHSPPNFTDISQDDMIGAEVIKETFIIRNIKYIQKKYPGINWILFEKVIVFGKNYGNYIVKDLDDNL
jgi:hypothetical protein